MTVCTSIVWFLVDLENLGPNLHISLFYYMVSDIVSVYMLSLSSWTILRQAPSAFEMRQQRNQRDSSGGVSGTTSRARNQYNASLNATVSLGEMLGNPLEISNDLLVQPTRHLNDGNSNSVDVYHAATTFAQLHRV